MHVKRNDRNQYLTIASASSAFHFVELIDLSNEWLIWNTYY